jgi:penicillin-binding protein 1C
LLFALVAFAGLWIALRVVPFDAANLFSGEISSILFDRKDRVLRAYLATDDRWRIPVRIDEISPWAIQATLAVEDRRFWTHPGIDPVAVARALLSNLRRGRIVSGASTISMQVAGLSQSRERTFGRKLRQAFRGFQLERARTKQEILELYFTNAPYGGNVCGIEAAARRFFGKSAAELTLPEAALLAGVPQSPSRLRPDRNPEAAARRGAHVLRRMAACGFISRAELDRALTQKPVIGAFDTVSQAPHFSDLVHLCYPLEPRIRTTLDLDIQREAEKLLAARLKTLEGRGVTNGSVIVIDNATGEVRALVGSADYNSVENDGQVNGTLGERSPGSTLKPLIYALAFDSGRMIPATMLFDVPSQFPGYEPENFDRIFRGPIAADKALAWSLNIPAITVLQEVGVGRMLGFLRSVGIETVRDPAGEYGLSLAIGTCGVRLIELANAYAGLARGGEFLPYRIRYPEYGKRSRTIDSAREWSGRGARRRAADTPTTGIAAILASEAAKSGDRGKRLLSTGACYFVTRALCDPALRAPEGVDPELAGLAGAAWKTGTSNGFRDAWTIAYDRTYTVGAWVGNFDARPSRALVGAQAAAPVALGMIKRLRSSGGTPPPRWPARPDSVRQLVICAETGAPASADCPTTATAECLKTDPGSASPLQTCTIHRRTRIDADTGEQVCPRCMQGKRCEERVFAFWPAGVAAWMTQQGMHVGYPPPHFRGCETVSRAPAPRITSPRDGDQFVVTGERMLEAQKVVLEAVAPPTSSRLYWFLDGELVRVVDNGASAFVAPAPGVHSLRCADEYGRADRITFHIEAD